MKKPDFVMRVFELLILAWPRRQMRRNSAKKLTATIGALDECIKTRSKLVQYNVPDVLRLFDASQFCLMYDADLTVLVKDTTCRANWWESRLYGRMLAMTMLECVEDIPAVLGKDFRESLASAISDPIHQQRISAITKGLSNFRKLHELELRKVRTISAAHRDHDPALQAAVIESLDIQSLMEMALNLIDLLSRFTQAMTSILVHVEVFRQIIDSFKKQNA